MAKKKAAKKPVRKLNSKQKKFAREYSMTGNATKAAKKAGYSEASAQSHVYEMLRKPEIQAELEKNEKRIQEKFDLKQDDIVKALIRIAFFDPMQVLEWRDDRLVYRQHMSDEYMAGANFTIYPEYQSKDDIREGVLRAKLQISSGDRRGALELLGKNIGMWRDKDAGHGTDSESRKAVIKRVSELLSKSRKPGGEGGSSQG